MNINVGCTINDDIYVYGVNVNTELFQNKSGTGDFSNYWLKNDLCSKHDWEDQMLFFLYTAMSSSLLNFDRK